MNILLIQPSYYVDSIKHKKWRQLFPLLTMPTIAAYTPPGHKVEIVDDFTEEVDYNVPCDLIGITALTVNAKRAYDIADEYRKRGKTVIMGGIHVSALPEEALEHCDSIVKGEAEFCWAEAVNDFENGKLKRIYKNDFLHDMKGLPVPRYELLKTKTILSAVTLETTRGCPFNCDFCCVTQFYGKIFRFKPVDEVIDQIKYIKKIYRPGRFIFVDDNITAVRSHAEEIFEKLIPLKIKWS
ncbi:MAG: cobalamin-dependent protein, partial [Spirochaetota bacterium]